MTDPERKALPWATDELDALRPRAKAALRKRYRGLRASLPPGARAARSIKVTERVIALDVWRDARVVAVFRSMPEEFDTAALIDDARRRGCTVCLPVVTDDAAPLTFRVAWRGDESFALTPGTWGIDEPGPEAPIVPYDDIELIVVPALAVDPRGHRLGYGRGFYDRTLPLATRAVSVAVVFEFQLIAELPDTARDVPVDRVVTDQRSLRASPDGAFLENP